MVNDVGNPQSFDPTVRLLVAITGRSTQKSGVQGKSSRTGGKQTAKMAKVESKRSTIKDGLGMLEWKMRLCGGCRR
jgi:hypothetical protein